LACPRDDASIVPWFTCGLALGLVCGGQAYSVQVQVLALRVLWTLMCEAALGAVARERHALHALAAHVGRHLGELVELLAHVKAAGKKVRTAP
jgi:hypothetical protein